MIRQTLDIYATSADMLRLCKDFEESIDLAYAFIETRKPPKVVVRSLASDIDLFWTSPSGFLGRTILLVPKGYEPEKELVELTDSGRKHALYPVDIERCVTIQEGGLFAQGDCLISGRLTNTSSDYWSKTTFTSLSKMTRKRFSKIRSYYVGPEAERLLQDGYRLTFQSSASRNSDLDRAD